MLFVAGGCVLDFAEVGPAQGAGPSAGGAGAGAAGGGPQQGGGVVVSCEADACLTIPEGFQGAVHLRVTDAAPAESACLGSGLLFEGKEGLTFEPASCNCACAGPDKACTLPVARAFAQQGCNIASPSAPQTLMADGGCTVLAEINNAPPQSLNLPFTPPTPPEGTACLSDDQPATLEPYSFDGYAQACRFVSDGCDEGSVCAAPLEGFATCFYREVGRGQQAKCPETLRPFEVFREGDALMDTRDCTCDCTLVGDAVCDTPIWELFDDADCLVSISDTMSGPCHTHPGGITAAKVRSTVNIFCGAASPVVQGDVGADTSMLVCCL